MSYLNEEVICIPPQLVFPDHTITNTTPPSISTCHTPNVGRMSVVEMTVDQMIYYRRSKCQFF